MIQKVEKFIAQEQLLNQEDAVLVALSGGRDSVLLLILLKQLGYRVSAAHCNFGLRASESDGDENFVAALCKDLGIPLFIKKFAIQELVNQTGESTQMVARKQRYEWFAQLCATHNIQKIATAHHLDDALETILINLTRGTGLKGLRGIEAQRDNIIRPLLCLTRAEINDYIFNQKIGFREDSSNSSKKYFRNKIRHDVIPVLRELNPSVFQSIAKTQSRLKRVENYWEKGWESWLAHVQNNKRNFIAVADLKNENQSFVAYLLQEKGFSADDVEIVLSTSNLEKGKFFIGQSDWRLVKVNNGFELVQHQTESFVKTPISASDLPLSITVQEVEKPSSFNLPKHQIYIDADALNGELYLKKWDQGDWFIPFGMNGKQKLSDFFVNSKMSLSDKENVWLLCDETNIVWVIGHRTDNRFRITSKTKKVLLVEVSN